MISPERQPRVAGVTYELTVVGDVGPAVRNALAPYASASSEHRTTLRTGVGEDRDLVDLVLMLASRGLEITDIVDLT
jgi:hypothetical protein